MKLVIHELRAALRENGQAQCCIVVKVTGPLHTRTIISEYCNRNLNNRLSRYASLLYISLSNEIN